MPRVTTGSAAKYILLPGIIPRVKRLFFSGFYLLAYYMAIVYAMLRILPAQHPYLYQRNIGTYGIHNVVLAAFRSLDFKWKNIDRIIMFFALLAGVVMLFGYVIGSFFFLLTTPAMAAGVNGLFGGWFSNPDPSDDIAFMMLDRMLGIPGIYDSRVTTTNEFGPMPNSFHQGMYALFAYFSWGLFAIAILVFLYFIVEIVLETTMTGTPFGKHFDNVLVPVRLVVGLGLLIPVAYGLNSAQWITLYIAKFGSNLATNAWVAFNVDSENPMKSGDKELVARPVTPDFNGLVRDLFVLRSCIDVDRKVTSAIRQKESGESGNGNVDPATGDIIVTGHTSDLINPYLVGNGQAFNLLSDKRPRGKTWPDGYNSTFANMYLEALRYSNGDDIKIVLGRYNAKELDRYPGGIEPICGEVAVPNLLGVGVDIPASPIQSRNLSEGLLIGESYMYAVMRILFDVGRTDYVERNKDAQQLSVVTSRYYYQNTAQGRQALKQWKRETEANDTGANPNCPNDSDNDGYDDTTEMLDPDEKGKIKGVTDAATLLGKCTEPVAGPYFAELVKQYQGIFSYAKTQGYDYLTGNGQQALNEECTKFKCGTSVNSEACQAGLQNCQAVAQGYAEHKKPFSSLYYKDLGQDGPFNYVQLKYGWGGAAIWYRSISETNGALTSATNTLPRITHYPYLMEFVASQRAAKDQAAVTGACEEFNPASAGDTPITLPGRMEGERELARMYYGICNTLGTNEYIALSAASGGSQTKSSGNKALNFINTLFGTKYLFSFRDNAGTNPLSQLSALGRALIDKSIQNIALAAGGSALSGLAVLGTVVDAPGIAQLMSGASGAGKQVAAGLTSIATVGLTAGIFLYYILPLMPFMYFFFAVGTWVKSVFEALVGMPLWSMAHLNMEGPGFASKASMDGYFLLLEIFIRPIVTLLALIGTMAFFMGASYVLNILWGAVTHNLTGFDPVTQASTNPLDVAFYRPKIDQLFFTITYVIIMFMLATSSFKLIDLIPDSIMRWIASVKTIGSLDSSEEFVEGINQTLAYPVFQNVSRLSSSGVSAAYDVAAVPGRTINDLKAMVPPQPAPPQQAGGPQQPQQPPAPPEAPAQSPAAQPEPDAPEPETPELDDGPPEEESTAEKARQALAQQQQGTEKPATGQQPDSEGDTPPPATPPRPRNNK